MMINPWFCYAISFAIALLTYLLPWSALYPKLSFSLFAFITCTIAAHLYFGYRISIQNTQPFKRVIPGSVWPAFLITIFIYLLWSADFIYEGGIPLVKILLGKPYNYRLFGVPSLHVFTVTFASFYTVYLFHLYRSGRNWFILILFLVNLAAAILIYSRAMFFFNLSSCFFLFLLSKNKYSKYFLYVTPLVLAILLFVFGVLGTLRVSRESKTKYDSQLFLNIGKATEAFSNSFVPDEYFWTYIYVTSPLANLQHNINTEADHAVTLERFAEMVNNEILMDFISKRINTYMNKSRIKDNRMEEWLNVSTVYSRPYSYLGWPGMIIMAGAVLFLPALYMKLLPADSPFYISALTILCTMYLFLAYDNTLRFTGLSFQLVYPLLLHYAIQKSQFLKKLFIANKVTNS